MIFLQGNACGAFTVDGGQGGCNIYRFIDFIHSPTGMTQPAFVREYKKGTKSLFIFKIRLSRMNMPTGYLPSHDDILKQNIGKKPTAVGNITSHRLREYEVKKLRSPACCRQENAIFSPCTHATDGK